MGRSRHRRSVGDVTDVEAIRAGIRRSVRELAVTEHPTAAGGRILINWRSVGRIRVRLASGQALDVDDHSKAPPRRGGPAVR